MNKLLNPLLFAILLLLTYTSFAQCDVRTRNLEKGLNRYSMSEKFYEDLDRGAKVIYVHTNFFGDKSDRNKGYLINIVVTYAWTGDRNEMTPNRLKITLPTKQEIVLTAEEMSRQTLNTFNKAPSDIKTIECVFKLSLDNVKALVEAKSVSKLIVEDYKQEMEIDLSDKYKGQLPEMLTCVAKSN